ncbi:hypothetical protein F8388_018529 [Cannabis sativa]|uniref:DNA-directed RNA polymerase n=1 Tax=Cannabis sativa TaxID=3483 RepID=A0A7J6G4Z7_CANSA|nr:hypothetical protein F8388_018529 [Cannabis sativa]
MLRNSIFCQCAVLALCPHQIAAATAAHDCSQFLFSLLLNYHSCVIFGLLRCHLFLPVLIIAIITKSFMLEYFLCIVYNCKESLDIEKHPHHVPLHFIEILMMCLMGSNFMTLISDVGTPALTQAPPPELSPSPSPNPSPSPLPQQQQQQPIVQPKVPVTRPMCEPSQSSSFVGRLVGSNNGGKIPDSPIKSSPIDKQFLAAPIKSAVDKFQLLPEFLKIRGLVKQHLDSFNYFINTEIKKIVRANDRIVSSVDPSIYLRFKDIRIGEPSVTLDGVSEKLEPQTCRLSDMTYAAPIKVDVEYIEGSHHLKSKVEKNDVIIGRMPIMLRSCCCVLYGKDEAELAKLGECPLDPGGYFVIKGTEKVLLIQEQLSKNRIIIDTDKKGNVNASVTSSSEAVRSKTIIQMENGKLYLMLNQFSTKKIPIMVVMKAMGMQSDQEVVQMLGRDPRYSGLLMPSIEVHGKTNIQPIIYYLDNLECVKEGIYTKEQALEYLESKSLMGKSWHQFYD